MRYLGDEVTRRRNLLVTATARSFLYHQVRLMVGLLKAVGCGEIRLEEVSAILEARDVRALRTAMAPAHGLYLANVEYDPKDFEDGDQARSTKRQPVENYISIQPDFFFSCRHVTGS